MRIDEIRTLAGPNIYNHKPVLLMRLHLEELTEKESYEIDGFIDRLLACLPGVHSHHCAMGRPGGFVERLYGGTYFAHIVEHVALELTESAGVPSFYGKTLYAGEPGYYEVVVEYQSEEMSRFLLEKAVELVDTLTKGIDYDLDRCIQEAKEIHGRTGLGPSTQAIITEAEARGIPWRRLNRGSLIQLGYGKYSRRFQATISDETRTIAVDIASDKELTKQLLYQAGISVPRGVVAHSEEDALASMSQLSLPIVVKPYDGCQGKGVSLALQTPEHVLEAFQLAQRYSGKVLMEEYISGRHYRVLIVGGKLQAASERVPAHVVGDGTRSIAELIAILNQDPMRGLDHEKPLTRLKIDDAMIAFLKRHHLTLDDIPANGERVFLRDNANLSTGGQALDVTDQIHPEIVYMCERAAKTIGLDICGVDLVTEDIANGDAQSAYVIEVNAAPGIRMHHYPSEGTSRNVGKAILESMYPIGSPSRIPIFSITGTNGKTTTTRMIAHVMKAIGKHVGMTTTEGVYVDGHEILHGDTTGPFSARMILSDRQVEVAVLETARGGMVRSGLGYDWADIAVITNVSEDHIGQDFIETVDDLIRVKALVAERVREGGTLIVNADDPNVLKILEMRKVKEVQKNIVYFSMVPNNPVIARGLAVGMTAYYLRDDRIVEAVGDRETTLMDTHEIPITLGGIVDFHKANALAAIAACRAHGLAEEAIVDALRTFTGIGHNPGRANLYQVHRGYVMVDYGHNPGSFEAVCQMASRIRDRKVTGVIGVPGDRDDSIVEKAMQKAVLGFDQIYIKEDVDLRGRARGEIAQIMYDAAHSIRPALPKQVILSEVEALDTAIRNMQDQELVIVFFEKLEPIKALLDQWNAAPLDQWTRDLPTRGTESEPRDLPEIPVAVPIPEAAFIESYAD